MNLPFRIQFCTTVIKNGINVKNKNQQNIPIGYIYISKQKACKELHLNKPRSIKLFTNICVHNGCYNVGTND